MLIYQQTILKPSKDRKIMIQIKDLTFRYKSSWVNVLENVNLQLNPGSIVGLLGKNGTGKTTLLNLITGQLFAQEGVITIDDENARTKSKSILEKLFFIPEELIVPNFTLEKFIKLYSPFYKDYSQEVMDECMREFGLMQRGKSLNKLSMGTKKKIMICFALATNVPYLLMDEPTNGLDIPSKRIFRKLINSHMTENRIIVISTHQVHDVEKMVDHIVIVGGNNLQINDSVEGLAEKYTFGTSPKGEVIYSEKSLEGNLCVARRTEAEEETPVNLELLFEAVCANPNQFK
jgi:ABC-2 type transport system ATP-binding protein